VLEGEQRDRPRRVGDRLVGVPGQALEGAEHLVMAESQYLMAHPKPVCDGGGKRRLVEIWGIEADRDGNDVWSHRRRHRCDQCRVDATAEQQGRTGDAIELQRNRPTQEAA
jgi:hypothetical protein